MCRMLGYLGTPVLLEDLLYAPDSSLLKQTTDAQMLTMLNLAGFGLAAWDPASFAPEEPHIYRSTQVAVFDRNLHALARKVRAGALVAHLRGVPYHAGVQINEQNLHPFRFDGVPLAMAHNGDLAGFRDMRYDLLEFVKPEIARRIQGSTDSEWLYALTLSALDDPAAPARPDAILVAMTSALSAVRKVRDRHGIRTSSSVNLIACDGTNLVATRFTFDFGCYGEKQLQGSTDFLSQWYTLGRNYGHHDGEWKMTGGAANADSVIVASEPLTRDISTWVEVPEYSALVVQQAGARKTAQLVALDV
jgi:glutamine amidotransferase